MTRLITSAALISEIHQTSSWVTSSLRRSRGLHTRREGGLVGQVGVGGAAVTARRELVEDRRGIRRELDAEALGELGGPRELVGNRRDHGTALPLQPSFEVDGRAVALEVART